MNNHSTPGNQHRDNRGGMLDEDLISPIPQPGEIAANSNITGGTNSTDEGDGARALTIAHTNISDEIAALRIGQRNGRFNDSSMELLVGFLNLEAAARDRGLLETRNNMHLEWLDIEGMTERLLLNINVDEWSSLSIGKKEISEVDKGCNDTEKEKMEKDVEGLENNETFQMERELIQRLEQTPKRKLSPDTQTPTGRSRKRSTSVYNSPVLRERIELAGGGYDQQENGAPDLIQGIGLLQRRETPGVREEI